MNIVEAVKLYKPGMILRRTSWGNKNFILRFRDEGNAESVEVHTIDIPHYSHINTVLGIDGLSAMIGKYIPQLKEQMKLLQFSVVNMKRLVNVRISIQS